MTETIISLASQALIDACEFSTEPFTLPERQAIARYEKRTEGIADCFDVIHSDLDAAVTDFTLNDLRGEFRAFFQMLAKWREAIRTLQEDFTDGRPISGAARRYLEMTMHPWKQSQEGYRAFVIDHFLGRDEYGHRFTEETRYDGCQMDGGKFLFAE